MLKDENFINIQGFMITKLGLSGNDLLVYAIIYGFSQDGDSVFKGTRAYLAEWCSSSERSISRNISNLLEKGLIEQVYKSQDCRQVHYRAVTPDKMSRVTICQGTGDKMSGVPVTKCQGARDKMSGAIYIDNIEDNIEDNIVVSSGKNDHNDFRVPTLEAVKTFAARHGTVIVDPVHFFDYYTANGWKVGKNPMKDWRAAFRMWERKEKAGTPAGSKAPAMVPIMEKEYSKEHLDRKEEEDLQSILDS